MVATDAVPKGRRANHEAEIKSSARSLVATDLLGGARVLGRRVESQLEAHDMVLKGMPAEALEHLLGALTILSRDRLLGGAVGMSLRTFQRHKDVAGQLLSREQGGRTWKFAEVLAKAIEIFGSRDDAEAWLGQPAAGLDQRRPIDLLATTAGAEAVETFLEQLAYGVYV